MRPLSFFRTRHEKQYDPNPRRCPTILVNSEYPYVSRLPIAMDIPSVNAWTAFWIYFGFCENLPSTHSTRTIPGMYLNGNSCLTCMVVSLKTWKCVTKKKKKKYWKGRNFLRRKAINYPLSNIFTKKNDNNFNISTCFF